MNRSLLSCLLTLAFTLPSLACVAAEQTTSATDTSATSLIVPKKAQTSTSQSVKAAQTQSVKTVKSSKTTATKAVHSQTATSSQQVKRVKATATVV